MRWSIIILMSLTSTSLACSKKEAPAPAEPEQAAETETPPSAEGSEQTPDPAEETPELPEELKGETPAVGAPPVVKVLEQGKEPRQALRWNVKPGFEQKMSADVSFAVNAVIAVIAFGSPKYVLTYELTMRAKKVEDDGSVRVTFKVDEARSTNWDKVDEEQQAPLKTALRGAGETTGSYTLSPRGRTTNVEINVPPGAGRMSVEMVDSLRWALALMTPLLPGEPLGQGAKWTLHQGIEQGGIQVNQLTTLEIVKLEGSRVELSMNVQQTAAPQVFKNPGTAATLSLSILGEKASFGGLAIGSLTWNLTELAPRAVNIESEVIKGVTYRPSPDKKAVSVAVKTDRAVKVIEK
jgi:hypothetical protein